MNNEICDIEDEIDEKPADHISTGNCSIAEVSFNLVNTTVGAGIIGLPFALAEAGFGLGILLAIIVAYLTNISLILMVYAGLRVDALSFPALVQHAFGRSGFWAVNLIVVVNGLGTMVSYLIIVGSLIPLIAGHYFSDWKFLTHRELVMSVSAILFIFPSWVSCAYRLLFSVSLTVR